MLKFVSNSEIETKDIASKLASKLNVGDIIILSGELGSGKTKFTEGFLSHWNLQDEISSPTFTIVNEYHSDNTNIYHFDVYRLEDIDEFYAIGGTEYFDNGISIIEWGELIEDILQKCIKINITKDIDNPDKRYISIEFKGDFDENISNFNI